MSIDEVQQLILAVVPGAEVYLRDLTGGGDHFEAFIVSERFQAQSTFQRHRLIMDGLKEALKGPLHAFTMKTYTPQEWAKAQGV